MSILLLKLILTPTLIGLASLAGRKWGHAISGWIVALPLTTGPIVLFLAITHGAAFAADTAAGILAGGVSLAAFTIVYGQLAARWTWLPTLAASSAAFLLLTSILRPLHIPIILLLVVVLAALALALRLLPRKGASASETPELPGPWDIPLRMVIATGFVLFITAIASDVGPHLAGLLSPFPFFTAIMAAFAQNQDGGPAAISVLHGLLLGLFSYAGFMFTLALLLIPAGIAAAFGIALLVVILFQAGALRILKGGIG